jgi:hypothetical protein
MLAVDYYALKKDIGNYIRIGRMKWLVWVIRKAIEKLINEAMKSALQIGLLYHEGKIEETRHVIGSIFHEKCFFDRLQHRTTRTSSIAELIFSVEAGIGEIK